MQDDNDVSNPRAEVAITLDTLVEHRLSRRSVLARGMVSTAAIGLAGMTSGCGNSATVKSGTVKNAASQSPVDNHVSPPFSFREIDRGSDKTHHVPLGYELDVLLKWGDPIFPDSPEFDPLNQSAAAQARQFGYNCDFIGFWPLAPTKEGEQRGLLCVNHEYTIANLMFPPQQANASGDREQNDLEWRCAIEMAAHGGSVVEIKQSNGRWSLDRASSYNRRIMARNTPMEYTGPAAGSPRLAIATDTKALEGTGTLNNCAGGITPWGTYLMSEENFHGYFLGSVDSQHAEASNHKRYGVPSPFVQWGQVIDEFNLSNEPNGPNRYGWVVEVDILNPDSKPKKRTALGRFKHEGAETIVAADGRVVVYMGDDERFEYVYKFVSRDRYDPDNRQANADLLDHGQLYVGKFEAQGALRWLPLTFGEGPLTPANGFHSQADVVIETRRAADLLGATPMDRPEDVQAQPGTGRAYIMLTNNHRRTEEQVHPANPRANNKFGHIVEIETPAADHTATLARWNVLVQCGDPDDADVEATWNDATSENGWFGSPDNCAFDAHNRLWVATDGNEATGAADGLWAIESQGPLRGTAYAFFRAPVGAEVCGPRFSSDGHTLFLSVQHPGDSKGSSFVQPSTRWPDFDPSLPPRPSVVAIKKTDGGLIGS